MLLHPFAQDRRGIFFAAGSDSGFNIASGDGLLFTNFDRGSSGRWLNGHENAVLTAPGGVDGASSYTFSIASTLPDYVDGAMAGFTSTITLNAPTLEGTLFTVSNTLVTPADWTSGPAMAEGGRESRSDLLTSIQNVQGGVVSSYNGRTDSPTNPNQWAMITATGESTGHAEGRSFYLSQTADLESPGTAGIYATVSATRKICCSTKCSQALCGGCCPRYQWHSYKEAIVT